MGAAEWTGYSNAAPSYSSYSSAPSYGYDTTNLSEHHSNFHIPTGK